MDTVFLFPLNIHLWAIKKPSRTKGEKEKKRCKDVVVMNDMVSEVFTDLYTISTLVVTILIPLIYRPPSRATSVMDLGVFEASAQIKCSYILLFRLDLPRRFVRTSRRQLVWKVVGMDRARSWPVHRSRTYNTTAHTHILLLNYIIITVFYNSKIRLRVQMACVCWCWQIVG
jgi:hypothetical protein